MSNFRAGILLLAMCSISACGRQVVEFGEPDDGDAGSTADAGGEVADAGINQPPTVITTLPVSGGVVVSIDTRIRATFSEAMAPATIDDITFTVREAGTLVPGTVSFDDASATATFIPVDDLTASRVFTATVSTGVTDVAGLPMAESYSWSFSTAANALAPVVIATTPDDEETNVSVTARPTATFSKAMDPATITAATFTLRQGASVIAGTVILNQLTNTAMFSPSTPLALNQTFTATISTGVTDTAGRAMAAPHSWDFTTTAAEQPPTVLSHAPRNLSTNVSILTNITAAFSKPMNPATINGTTFTVRQGANPVQGVVTLNTETNTATFIPTTPLSPARTYTVTITTGAEDTAGLALAAAYTWTFTTEGPPTVTATSPLDLAINVSVNKRPTATFSKRMDPASLNAGTFTLMRGATAVTGTVGYDPASRIATFTPSVPLLANTVYTATITTGAEDLNGINLTGDKVWTFTTAATEQAPEVIATSPLDLATGVSLNKRPTATFSKPMDPATINGLSFTLSQNGMPVPGSVTYDALTETAIFSPTLPLVADRVYTATITTDAKDVGGLALAADRIWTFSTSVNACTQAPVVLGAAGAFAVLGGSTVTNTGLTTVTGDLGVSPGAAVTGFPPGILVGALQAGNPAAAAGIAALTIAYNDAAGRTLCPISVAGNLGGMTLAPGLYKSTSSLAVSSGDLTLDAQGDGDAVWIFQVASTLTTTPGRQVILINGARAENVYWQVGTSATLGTTSHFVGTIMADQSITLGTGASLDGRALARIGAVALDSNIVVAP